MNIKFVSYDGEEYSYCLGTLVLNIDGVDYNLRIYPVGVRWKNYRPMNKGSWELAEDSGFDREATIEIEAFINNNDYIDKPCCGGCS